MPDTACHALHFLCLEKRMARKTRGSEKVFAVPTTLSLFDRNRGNEEILKSPLQFEIKIISPQLACELNKKWHSRLPEIHWSNIVRNTHYVCFGAYFSEKWFAVAIWSSPVAGNRLKDARHTLELRRFAICKDAPKNTASRMMAVMIKVIRRKFPDIKKLISYQDTEVHRGTIYKASNWTIGSYVKNKSWSTGKRKRNKEQSTADKIRWEYYL